MNSHSDVETNVEINNANRSQTSSRYVRVSGIVASKSDALLGQVSKEKALKLRLEKYIFPGWRRG